VDDPNFRSRVLYGFGNRFPYQKIEIILESQMDLMHVTSHPPTRDLPEAAIGQS
ncbi:hypothetical protein AVEN_119001-1, partial [Araneus ventricosus]